MIARLLRIEAEQELKKFLRRDLPGPPYVQARPGKSLLSERGQPSVRSAGGACGSSHFFWLAMRCERETARRPGRRQAFSLALAQGAQALALSPTFFTASWQHLSFSHLAQVSPFLALSAALVQHSPAYAAPANARVRAMTLRDLMRFFMVVFSVVCFVFSSRTTQADRPVRFVDCHKILHCTCQNKSFNSDPVARLLART